MTAWAAGTARIIVGDNNSQPLRPPSRRTGDLRALSPAPCCAQAADPRPLSERWKSWRRRAANDDGCNPAVSIDAGVKEAYWRRCRRPVSILSLVSGLAVLFLGLPRIFELAALHYCLRHKTASESPGCAAPSGGAASPGEHLQYTGGVGSRGRRRKAHSPHLDSDNTPAIHPSSTFLLQHRLDPFNGLS